MLVLADRRPEQQHRHRRIRLLPPGTERRLGQPQFAGLAVQPRAVVMPTSHSDRRSDILRPRRLQREPCLQVPLGRGSVARQVLHGFCPGERHEGWHAVIPPRRFRSGQPGRANNHQGG